MESTLTPAILLKMAKIVYDKPSKDNSSNTLDDLSNETEFRDNIIRFMAEEFDSDPPYFFSAVYNFLNVNNFIPEIINEQEVDTDNMSYIDMLDDRD